MKKLIKKFPCLYNYFQHLQRKRKIGDINRIKRLPYHEKKILLEKLYLERIGHKLDWNNLQTYTEKMQWEKFFHKDSLKTLLSDKYKVRFWVSEKIGQEYLIPLLGVWDKFDDIDFSTLPNSFVLKTNHGSGTNVIVKDKSQFKKKEARRAFNDWMEMDYAYNTGFEMHYSEIDRKIIAEKYMETELGELQDYKFLCFGGKPYYCWVDMGRYSVHTRNVYNMNWELQEWNQAFYGIYKDPIEKPKNFDKMIRLATILCNGFPHVRVDFYNIDGTIYFGEMTFTNGCGFDPIIPEKYDLILGNLWNINN